MGRGEIAHPIGLESHTLGRSFDFAIATDTGAASRAARRRASNRTVSQALEGHALSCPTYSLARPHATGHDIKSIRLLKLNVKSRSPRMG